MLLPLFECGKDEHFKATACSLGMKSWCKSAYHRLQMLLTLCTCLTAYSALGGTCFVDAVQLIAFVPLCTSLIYLLALHLLASHLLAFDLQVEGCGPQDSCAYSC